MELATALHHSAQRVEVPREEEEHAEYVGPRAQKAPPPGMRPAPLAEVAGPQGWPGTPSSPGAGVPSLAPPVLAGSAGEGVDSSALAFLATRALLDREEEEEAEELRVLEEKVVTKEQRLLEEVENRRGTSEFSPLEYAAIRWCMARQMVVQRMAKRKARKRRKKKRKKKKLPKVSSHSSCGRARRRQRWYAGHFFPCVSLRHGGRCPCCAGRAGTQVQFFNKCFVPVWLFHRRSSWTGLLYLRRHQHPYRGAEAFPYGPSVLQTIGRPQLQAIDKVVHVHIVQVVQSTGAVRVGSLHRLCCMEWQIGVDSRRFPVVQLVLVSQETLQSVEIPQAQFWDKVFMPVVQSQAQFLDKVFMPVEFPQARFSRLNSTTLRSSLQSSIIAWAVWYVVNYAVLGPDSQDINGLYAAGQFSDKVVFLPGVGQRLALIVQTVLKPVEVPQVQYLDKDVLMHVIARPLQCRNLWCSHRCSSGTRMLTCSLLCQTGFWSRRTENSGVPAVAVLHPGC